MNPEGCGNYGEPRGCVGVGGRVCPNVLEERVGDGNGGSVRVGAYCFLTGLALRVGEHVGIDDIGNVKWVVWKWGQA